LSKDEAWRIMALETLADAGLIQSARLTTPPQPEHSTSVSVPILESKVLKVVRIEPEDNARIRTLLKLEREDAGAARQDPPSESSIIRRALRLGLDELQRQSVQPPSYPGKTLPRSL